MLNYLAAILSETFLADTRYATPTVGWGTLALVNAGLAQGKDRSGTNWFLLSLLLGPVATFVLVVFCDSTDNKFDR